MELDAWVYCSTGVGFKHDNGIVSKRSRHFPLNSVGKVREMKGDMFAIWFIGTNETWEVLQQDVEVLDVTKTGDKFVHKICNICHRLLAVDNFARNQNNIHGIVRRPSCNQCRTDIDKRAPKSRQAKIFEKKRPQVGEPFQCPICQKRSIVGITAKVVADHDHHTGNIRDFICDSCNTGLGRFKNGENYLYNAIAYLKEREH
ncbi:MAG: endonuclease VII domain-containing protein [Spirochaetota bacterium]